MSAVEPLAVSRMTGDRPPLAQLAHDLDAVEVGHDDVEQDDVRADFLGLLAGPPRRRRGDDPEALLAEGDRDELGDAGLVVGDEDERLGAHRSPPGSDHGDGLDSTRHPPGRRACGGPGRVGGLGRGRRRAGQRDVDVDVLRRGRAAGRRAHEEVPGAASTMTMARTMRTRPVLEPPSLTTTYRDVRSWRRAPWRVAPVWERRGGSTDPAPSSPR